MISEPLPVVAVVDDDEGFLASLIAGLAVLAAEVELVAANAGRAAAQLLASRRVAVLVTDLCMPGVDGHAVLEVAHRADPRPALVVLSASVSTETTLELSRFQPLTILDKPVDLPLLVNTIRELLAPRPIPGPFETTPTGQRPTAAGRKAPTTDPNTRFLGRSRGHLESTRVSGRHRGSVSPASLFGDAVAPRRARR